MILSSAIGSIITPIAQVFGWVLAAYYSFSHNYGIAIILLTLTVMVIVFPLTRKGTRSMMRMQLLQPQLKVIQNRYKSQPGQTSEERQANRAKLNEEMMALYRENNVSPTGGCLPMFLQFPIFIVLYDVIRGMTRTVAATAHSIPAGCSAAFKGVRVCPQYIATKTALYQSLIHSHGTMRAFGLNLADSVRTHQPNFTGVIPYVVVILVAVALQYVSIWQITNRNPAASQANAQMQAAQKFMPLIFVFFYIVLPAGVGVYFIVSSAFRIGQQEWMYKHDKMITETVAKLKQQRAANAPKTTAVQERKGFMARLREAAATASANTAPALESGSGRSTRSGGGGNRPGGTRTGNGGNKPGSAGAGNKSGSSGGKPSAANRRGGGAAARRAQQQQQQQSGSQAPGGPGVNGSRAESGTNGRVGGPDAANVKPGTNRSQSKRPRRPR